MQKNREFLNCFWDLAVLDQEKRINAGLSLMDFLQIESIEKDDLDYAVNRLVKGLSSSREAARQGFSACLSQLINAGIFKVSDILTLVEQSTKVIVSYILLFNNSKLSL